jgi:hypothetical protein
MWVHSVFSHTQDTVCLSNCFLLIASHVDVMTSLLPFIIVWIADLEVCSAVILDPKFVKLPTITVIQATVSTVFLVHFHGNE